MNADALGKAFDQLEEQNLSFESCQTTVTGVRAQTSCQGTAQYVPRLGNKDVRVDRRQWRFSLSKSGEQWLIQTVDVR